MPSRSAEVPLSNLKLSGPPANGAGGTRRGRLPVAGLLQGLRRAAGNEGSPRSPRPQPGPRATGMRRLAGGASTACTVTTAPGRGPATAQPRPPACRWPSGLWARRGVGGCLERPHGPFSGPPARFCGLGGRVVSIPAVHRSDTGQQDGSPSRPARLLPPISRGIRTHFRGRGGATIKSPFAVSATVPPTGSGYLYRPCRHTHDPEQFGAAHWQAEHRNRLFRCVPQCCLDLST